MELNLQRQPITVNEVVFDGLAEQPIECDALLPDYCPDIVKILKCTVSTAISSSIISGDRFTIEGMATAHVFYSGEGNQIRHTEYKIPFAKQVELRSAPNDPVVTVLPNVDYVNCRAVNQRRIDIRGAVTFKVKVTDQKQEQVISDASGGGLQVRRELLPVTELLGQTDSSFTISEELDLGYGKSPVGTIIRVDSRVNVQDYKVIAGKVVCKADFMLHICYQPVEAAAPLEVMEYTLPLSQIIDSDGSDENSVCDVGMFVQSCDVRPAQDGDGEYRRLSLDASVRAVVASHRHKEVAVASDCYSTKFESSCKRRRVGFLRLCDQLREAMMHKASLDLPEGVKTVLDAWCEIENLAWKYEKPELELNLRLVVSMFAQMEDGECRYFEQTEEMSRKVAVQNACESILFEPTADILSCAYNIAAGEKIDIRCEVLVKGSVHCNVSCEALSEIAIDETNTKPKEQNKLYLYYADEGESVWNIAKQYNTAAGAIWEENNVEQDILPQKAMLLIPIV